MPDSKFPRSLIHRLEAEEQFPLHALDAIRDLRDYLDRLEDDALCRSRELGASIVEIAETTRKTRQAVYNRLKQLQERQLQQEALEEPLIGPDPETKQHP